MTRSARLKLWMMLGTALVLAVALLLGAVWSRRSDGHGGPDAEEQAAAPRGIQLKLVDERGDPVHHAQVFVRTDDTTAPEDAGSWSPEDATLTLPPGATASSVAVQARGFRFDVVERLEEDRVFVLQRGYTVRLKLVGDAVEVPAAYRIVLQINPSPDDPDRFTVEQREALVDLIDLVSPLADERLVLPGGIFGYAAWGASAAEGILVPFPGTYSVRWGLLDPPSGVWYSIRERATFNIDVEDDTRPQTFPLPLTQEAMARTREGLEARMAESAASSSPTGD